jgi:hypothetical protein
MEPHRLNPPERPQRTRATAGGSAPSTFGVVVPVFRGAYALTRSLGSLARQTYDGDLHIVVAVNDGLETTYATAQELAEAPRSAGHTCTVIRTPRGRGPALNAGDALLPPGPRLYLDQDAELGPRSIDALRQALAPETPWEFAAPRLQPPRPRSLASHAYYSAWRQLPYVRRSPATMGAYAVSARGRTRWRDFPPLHSDDKYVRLQFAPSERAVATDATYSVLVPEGLRELVRARRRYDGGNRELLTVLTRAAASHDPPRFAGIAATVLRQPARWPAFAVLGAVHALAAAPLAPAGAATQPLAPVPAGS